MKTAAIICEYNPFHKGHNRQFAAIRQTLGDDTGIVCLMSGSYVQRGEPAVFDKYCRSAAAVECGADLVLELPLTAALSSAEGFALGGVEILTRLGGIDYLCFGCETGNQERLMETAEILLSPAFSEQLRKGLTDGDSFASLRQRTLTALGGDGSLLEQPNDILAVEYCKALLTCQSGILPLPIHRGGSYHDDMPDPENPSATSLRSFMPDASWLSFVPEAAARMFADAPIHRLSYGERAMLARLRAMDDTEFEALPYGAEGLWRKLMKESRQAPTIEALVNAVKSRRYARSRIMRMVMCAFLGIREEDFAQAAPYVRILAFNETGQKLLRRAAEESTVSLLHPGQRGDCAYAKLEARAERLYPLFLPPERDCVLPAHVEAYRKNHGKIR